MASSPAPSPTPAPRASAAPTLPPPSPTPTPTPAPTLPPPSPTPTPTPAPTLPPPSPTPTPTPAPTLPPLAGFASIPAGSFTMGSPAAEPGRYSDETQHPVKLTRGFYMQTTEVTQAQWQALMGNNPSGFTGATRPVEQVSWWDAVAYANALSAKEGLSPAYSLKGCS
ncbi:MAG: SUMF1/EgtB/PvdO family nonheme iron enzyme, partial [Candidatus Sericytochromatia bacterium]|nr:SUMF1/EgtB/PvdO family nonheme iron enzyme [Candidatus Tanganyikabacteria bacterium]